MNIKLLPSAYYFFKDKEIEKYSKDIKLFDFSCQIIEFRFDKNISQKELADILKVKVSLIRKIESGRYKINSRRIKQIILKFRELNTLKGRKII